MDFFFVAVDDYHDLEYFKDSIYNKPYKYEELGLATIGKYIGLFYLKGKKPDKKTINQKLLDLKIELMYD